MTERRAQVCLVLLALSVFAVYAFRLEHTPPHLHRDEMMFALQAQSIAATGHDLEGRWFPLYFEMRLIGERVWFQPILVYVTALFLKVLPLSEQTVRIPSTVIGVIDVLLLYFIARRLFESRSKAFVSCVMANSRVGIGSSVSHMRMEPLGYPLYKESSRSRTRVARARRA